MDLSARGTASPVADGVLGPSVGDGNGGSGMREADVRFTRRHLQLALGVLWLLDAGLQAQPYMFGTGFARDIIAPAADGQPVGVSGPVHWSASLIGGHPAFFNTLFVLAQAALGLALLWRRSARLGLAGSVSWGLGVWWFGEGLGGATGGVSLLDGAPGAALLYAALAVLAWPSRESVAAGWEGEKPVAVGVVVPVWVGFWLSGAVLGRPGGGLVGLYVLVALWALLGGAWRRLAAVMGAGIAVGAWVTAQGFGELASGQATDPNSGPLILLLALALGFSATREEGSTVLAARLGGASRRFRDRGPLAA